jgi:hypothetical protein
MLPAPLLGLSVQLIVAEVCWVVALKLIPAVPAISVLALGMTLMLELVDADTET